MDNLLRLLPPLPLTLKEAIVDKSTLIHVPSGSTLIRAGQYVQGIPLVLKGSIKVFSSYGNKELLLYYIEAQESCIVSFSACLHRLPSQIEAVVEQDATILLLPTRYVLEWQRIYPAFNEIFFDQYNQRYSDLLNTIQLLLFEKMDVRIKTYLQEKVAVTGEKLINMRHHEIAKELGTAREVVSRIIKKLEKEGLVQQTEHGIIFL